MENQEPLAPIQSSVPAKDPKSSKRQAVILIVLGLILIAATAPFLYQKYFAQETTENLNTNSQAATTNEYNELIKSLPPDPGEAGKKTLEGIDSDEDGVRDDVQRYIVLNNPESEKLRAGLFQMAQALQRVIIESSNKTASITNMNAVIRSRVCLRYFVSWEASVANMDELLSEALNTKVRTQAFTEADIHNSGTTGSPVLDRATQRASCDFDPDSLPN